MATVSPYGDPNAHGSLNKSLTFRRYKNKVILQSLSRPTITNTPAQITQRAKMTAGNQAYSMLTNATKYFYHKRATQKATTRKGMFMHAYMRNFLPSTLSPIHCKSIENMVIFNTAGFYPDNLEISIYNVYPPGINPLQDLCELWNKSGSILQIESSEIGPDGVIHGTLTFLPGKFDNGMFTDNIADYATYDLRTDETAGAVEIWFTAEVNSADLIADICIFSIDARSVGSTKKNFMHLYYSAQYERWYFKFGRGTQTVNLAGLNTPFLQGDKIHLLLLWDVNGIDGTGYYEELYVNEASNIKSTQLRIPIWGAYAPLFHVGIRNDTGIGNPVYNTLDNPKIYSFPAVTQELIDYIFAGKDIEGFHDTRIYGIVLDNSNLYTKLQEVPLYGTQVINLTTSGGNRILIPFRYLISIEWLDEQDVLTHSEIRLPQMTIEALQTVELFLSRDWSVYWDIDFKRLACASRL